MNPPDPKLTVPEIHRLLAQLASDSAAPACPSPDSDGLRRLMDIYCVVKAGGVNVQVEAAQAHLHRELTQLKADLAAAEADDPGGSQSHSLLQEIEDLHRSVNWRLTRLQSIDPAEEAAVAACLTEIEARVGR
jgi:hypothetical protein